jgi:L-ascorbate metabolism protein UlaG (beta-lactamase superfamily)
MVITYHGGECFKVSQGDLTLAFNVPSKESSFKVSRFGADVALTTTHHRDMSGVEQASLGDREPFTIEGPGEYDVQGIAVRGYGATSQYGGEHLNTIYSVILEGTTLCFLGALGNGELPPAAKQELDEIDILFVPIGGGGVLDYSAAYKLAVGLEPKMVIPMHYDKESLKAFLKEASAEGTKPVDKLTLKKKDLDGKEAEIVVLAEA